MVVPVERTTIVAGMRIIDKDGEQIVTIETVHLAQGTEVNTTKTERFEELRQLVGHNLKISIDIYKDGFLYVERGFFRDNTLVSPQQIDEIIDEIKDDSIYLNVTVDELFEV